MSTRFCKRIGLLFFTALIGGALLLAAEEGKAEAETGPCILETSLWMAANLLPDPPGFYQLSLGYEMDEKNVLYLNGITWSYPAPLGIPWGPSFEAPEEEYPGSVRAFGLGLGYQRFIWEGLFLSLYATPFLQNFSTSQGEYLQSGFQLFLQFQAGWQVELFHGRFFLKPALSFNYWPVNTNFPEAFQLKENKWPNYFLFEPHLNIGFRF